MVLKQVPGFLCSYVSDYVLTVMQICIYVYCVCQIFELTIFKNISLRFQNYFRTSQILLVTLEEGAEIICNGG